MTSWTQRPRRVIAGVHRRAARTRERLRNATLHEGALTQHLLDTHCMGQGAEIGPGRRRYGDPARTTAFDLLQAFHAVDTVDVDVLADASALPVRDGAYDYLISSHCLEHVPDTLATLEEWLRVLRPGGTLFLVLPHMARTFDRARTPATIGHHLAERGIVNDPDAPLHWDEWEQRLLRDQPPWTRRADARRADGKIDPRFAVEHAYIHYHCWTQDEMVEILRAIGCRIRVVLELMPERRDSFLVVATKSEAASPA